MTADCVKKILSLVLCFFLLGCGVPRKMLNIKKTDLDDLTIIMLDLNNDVRDGQTLSVSAVTKRIKSDYIVRCIYDSEGFCECKCRKGKDDIISVRCANLGRWRNSWDIILCEIWKKGSGIRDSRIVLCSRSGDKLQIYKVIYLRTRYTERDSSTPVFDNYDNIYYITNYDVQDFALLAGISNLNIEEIRKEEFPMHWNSCRAVYNISTGTSKIFSITLNPNIKFCSELLEIMPFISSMHNNKQYYIDQANIPIFLQQLKLLCCKKTLKRNMVKTYSTASKFDNLLPTESNY